MNLDHEPGSSVPATPGAAGPVITDQLTLRVALSAAIGSVTGVDRVEPTLRSALAAVVADAGRALHRLSSAPAGAADALAVGVDHHLGHTDVAVDVATLTQRPAIDIAREIRAVIMTTLTLHGRTPGRVEVSVLDITAPTDEAAMPPDVL